MKNKERTLIDAKVERIRYPKREDLNAEQAASRYYIIACDVGVCKGMLDHRPKIGEVLSLDGCWEVSKFNGQPEFVFVHANVHVPTDERSLLRYVCEMTPGFGPAMEERIWAERGDKWRKVSLDDDVRGLSADKLADLQRTIDFIEANQMRAKVVAWLLRAGLTIKMAEAAFAKWGAATTTKVNEDPYILAHLPGYGFADADSHIRSYFNIGREDRRRVVAAIRYYIDQLSVEDTAVSWDELLAKVLAAIDVSPQAVADETRAMFQSGLLVAFSLNRRIALSKNFENEAVILRFAQTCGRTAAYTKVKARQPKPRDFDLDSAQMEAVQHALDHRFCIINGGAGCGKTSLIHALCCSLQGHGDTYLSAFAGKAAARLREATGHDASTIHRMLGWMGEANKFALKSLAGHTVILDESSMVSSDLLAEIVKRNPDRLVLVGDEAQLPPVGSGQPFHDLVRMLPECVRTLSTCYRSQEAVLSSALSIRNGQLPHINSATEHERYEFVSMPEASAAHAAILDRVKDGTVDFDTDAILCCRNGDGASEPLSVRSLNADIKAIVNPGNGIGFGDRIICTANSSDLDVWNGTTGRCRGYDTSRSMWVDLDSPNSDGKTSVLIPRDKVRDWTLAYAMTVHKAQGSQYRRVIIAIAKRDMATLLSRPMVYTAVTRAKKECIVIGNAWAFSCAIAKMRRKHTVMQELESKSEPK